MAAVVHWTRCEPCMYGQHFDPPEEHDWAGPEDVAHALANGYPDPTGRPCACTCSGHQPVTVLLAEDGAR